MCGLLLFPTYPLALSLPVCHYVDMFCINCFNPTTSVANSRPHSKRPVIWRRRHCKRCGYTITTYERPSLAGSRPVLLDNGDQVEFNLGKLIISLAAAFAHAPKEAAYNALWLAQTVEETLLTQVAQLTPQVIATEAHHILKRFDQAAALQYALRHQLLTSTRRRPGRPSVSEK